MSSMVLFEKVFNIRKFMITCFLFTQHSIHSTFDLLNIRFIQAEMEQEMTSQKEMIQEQRAEVLRLQTEYENTKPPTPTEKSGSLPKSGIVNGVVRKREPSLGDEHEDKARAVEMENGDPRAENQSSAQKGKVLFQ